MKRPPVIIFVPDSYRGDVLGHTGNSAAVTPHLDAFARDAVSFSQTFAQNPVCTPSRCSFMTGWYPHVHGHRSMLNMLKPHEPHLLKVLRENGYTVWWGGKNDVFTIQSEADFSLHCDIRFRPPRGQRFKGHRPAEEPAQESPLYRNFYRGVCKSDPEGEYPSHDRGVIEGAVEFIRTADADKPFCLFIPISSPHPAYHVLEEYYNRIDPDTLPPRLEIPAPGNSLPLLDAYRKVQLADKMSEDDWREIKHVYYAMCAQVDDFFGQVLAALREKQLYDKSLITFFSDHGDYCGDYSMPEKTHFMLQDCLLHVPFLIKPPTGTPLTPGTRNHLTELVDFTATVYDLLGINPGYTPQGRSLRQSLADDSTPHRDAAFAMVGAHRGEAAFLNNETANLPVTNFYGMTRSISRPYHLSGSLAVMIRTAQHKLIRRPYQCHQELYDLQSDPGELNNLYHDPAYSDIRRQLEERLLQFYMETSDVLPHQQDQRRG